MYDNAIMQFMKENQIYTSVPLDKLPIKCWECNSMATLHVCGHCRVAKYCSPECQKKAWWIHKSDCDFYYQNSVIPLSKKELLHVEGTARDAVQDNLSKAWATYGTEFDGQILATPYYEPFDHDPTLYATLVCKENHELVLGKMKYNLLAMECDVVLSTTEQGMIGVDCFRKTVL